MPVSFSIITACRNAAGTLGAALDSLERQAGASVQHVVVDGASTDNTLELLHARPRAGRVLVSEPDHGFYDALNKGLVRCTGDVVGLLHANDVYAHDRVLARVGALFADGDVEAVYGDLEYVSAASGRVVRRWRAGEFTPGRLARGWMPPHPTFFARRSLYERLGGFDTRYRIAGDYDLLLRFLGRGGVRPAYLPEVLVRMRLGGMSNRSLANIARKSAEDYRALRANGVGGVAALAWKNLGKLGQFL
jgi:glycosyltransferase involved in cell wall biosynthesis